MFYLRLMDHPMVSYGRAWVGVRTDRMREENGRSAGASAIEWAIITGLLALVAFAAYVIISEAVTNAANTANTQTVNNGGGGDGG